MNNYEKWIHVLRWKDYQQGKGQLRTEDNKFCCLGVAVDLYAKSKGAQWTGTAWEKWKIVKEDEKDFIDENGNNWEIKVMEILGSEDSMPLEVGEWLEINEENIDIGHMGFKTHLNKNSIQYNWDGKEGCYNRLTAINDSGIFSFPSIAFILEAHQDITVLPPEENDSNKNN